MATAAITGTVGDGATEAEIVAGTGTIVITLTDDTWVAAEGLPVTASLLVYYDSISSTITDDANGVSQWNDISGNNNHLVQTDNSYKPAKTTAPGIGGSGTFTTVNFDGTDNFLSMTSGLAITEAASLFVVLRPDNTTLDRTIVGGISDCYNTRVNSSNKVEILAADIASIGIGTTSVQFTNLQAMGITYTTDGFWQAYINTSTDGSGTTNRTFAQNVTRAGAKASQLEPFDGDIAALVVYSAALSETDAGSVLQYLTTRYTG